MGVVTKLFQKPAKRIFNGTSGNRMPVGFNRRQMNNLFPDIHFGNFKPFRENLIQLEKFGFEFISGPFYLWQRYKRQAVMFQNRCPEIVFSSLNRVSHHSFILYWKYLFLGKSVLQ